MSKTMRAVGIKNGKGPAQNLHLTTIDTPVPQKGQVLVKVKAFGLNRMDLMQREGNYPVPPQAPATLGVEFSGVIVEGAKDEETSSDPGGAFKAGDEVFGLAYGGAYAEYIAVSHRMLLHKPKEISFEKAAGIPETWITALQAMYLIGDFQPGNSILWHAGASSVSLCGIQLSKAAGASAIYITAGSQAKIDTCKRLGATQGFNYHTQDWAAEISALQKDSNGGIGGVNTIVDYIGAPYFAGNLAVAAKDGRIVSLAMMGGAKIGGGSEGAVGEVNLLPILMKRIRIEGSTLRSRDSEYQGRLRDMLAEKVVPNVVDGTFEVVVEKVLPWEDIVEAHTLMESNSISGKIICTISDA